MTDVGEFDVLLREGGLESHDGWVAGNAGYGQEFGSVAVELADDEVFGFKADAFDFGFTELAGQVFDVFADDGLALFEGQGLVFVFLEAGIDIGEFGLEALGFFTEK
ncbi:MAG: hypothetical protein PCFJNLEI_02243 [Verrucomicrobiae bacterium]|nr:hypothetical protein [Verrucomicrobiae bacterium]